LERVVMLCDEDSLDAATLAPLLGVGRVPCVRQPVEPVVTPETPAPVAASIEEAPAARELSAQSYADAMAQFEAAFLSQALEACGGRVAEAAARVGISRAAFYKKLAAGKARQ
ncbi:MAG: AAA family ATPase, partial [Cupriavidus sp.]|nr:AAA family ATPase [Cupriavidus sp.]